MDPVLATLLYKTICVGSGAAAIYLGYRLFILGIFNASGNFNAQFGDSHILLKKAAPGTFFALFGVIVISVTVFKGIRLVDDDRDAGDLVASKFGVIEDASETEQLLTSILSALREGRKLSAAEYAAAERLLSGRRPKGIYIGLDRLYSGEPVGSYTFTISGNCQSCRGTGKDPTDPTGTTKCAQCLGTRNQPHT